MQAAYFHPINSWMRKAQWNRSRRLRLQCKRIVFMWPVLLYTFNVNTDINLVKPVPLVFLFFLYVGKYLGLFPLILDSMHNWSEWYWHDWVSNHYTPPSSWWSWNTSLFTSHAWVLVQILLPVYKWSSWTMNRLINLATVLQRACVKAKTRIQSYTWQAWIYEN